MKTTANVLASIVALALLALPIQATTIHVPDEQPTIQAGIDAASAGDTVLIACGTYYEHDIVMKSGVCLTSETGQADCVTVDAQRLGRVFYCSGVDNTASVEGLTVTGGSLDGYNDHGAGMHCINSSPAITNCTFHDNGLRSNGGGMYCDESSPTLTSCTFSENSTSGVGDGGGLYCRNGSSPILTDCHFSENVGAWGGGMWCSGESSATLLNCAFSGNTTYSGGLGGGLFCSDSSPSLTGVVFSGNATSGSGGAMCCWGSSPALTNCTLSGNGANGGSVYCDDGSSPSLTHCIIAFGTPGIAVFCDDALSEPSLICCDVYGNASGDWVGCIADQYGVNGNFSADPIFCGDLNPDEPYTLHVDSPCASENNPECGLIGAWGVACGLTAVEPVSWGAIKSIFR